MKKIAIIGGGYLQLPLVLKSKEIGLETHCFSWAKDAVCKDFSDFFYPISITEKNEILKVCEEVNIDGITSIATDLAVKTVCFIAEKLMLTTNSYNSAIICTDKFLMREALKKNNIKVPKYQLFSDKYPLTDFKLPVIVKPTDRSGSRGVMRVNNISDFSFAIKNAISESFSKVIIIEEFISGVEISVETISWEGKHYILGITDKKTTGEPFFVEIEHHQPSLLDKTIIFRLEEETKKSLNALNIMYGASHSEFIITEANEIYCTEIGARMGGDFIGSDLIELSTGYDFLKGVIEIAMGKFTTPISKLSKYSGVYFLCKQTINLLDIIKNPKTYQQIIKTELIEGDIILAKNSGDRSGYFIYQNDQKFFP